VNSLPDESFSKLHGTIKQIALNAMESTKPSGIFYGTVLAASPLQVQIDQKMTLGAEFLVLSSLVQDFTVSMTVDHQTEVEGAHTHQYFDSDTGQDASGSLTRTSDPATHLHGYKGTKAFRVHLGLKAGEKVILIQVQGGQQFLVLDRIRG
jgi:hypothetical protein